MDAEPLRFEVCIQRGRRAATHLRIAARQVMHAVLALCEAQPAPLPPTQPPTGPTHPSELCRCEAGPDAPPEQHRLACPWAAVMCRTCAGSGHCPDCHGDGTAPDAGTVQR